MAGMFAAADDGDRAPVEQHQDDRFAGRGDNFHQVFLSARNAKVDTVASGESFDGDFHLLAFEARREAEDQDHGVGLFGGSNGVGGGGCSGGAQTSLMLASFENS